jgi:RimJ/RimL family protein N-acetyltransferase
MDSTLEISKFYPKAANNASFEELSAYVNQINAELHPEQPPQTTEELATWMRRRPPSITHYEWLARIDGQIVAEAELSIWKGKDNQHLADLWISVLPAFRRRQIATRLVRLVAEKAREEQRLTLHAPSNDRAPAGAGFLRRIGAEVGQTWTMNELRLRDLDRELLRRWNQIGEGLADEFDLELRTLPFPEEELASIAALRSAITDSMPWGDLDRETETMTPAFIREWEDALASQSMERWTLFLRHRATKAYAGYTEVFWNFRRPHILQQGDTGVLPQFRGRGLGRWLKAAMLDKVLRERPRVEVVRTGNAASNAAMLRINQELGFKPFLTSYTWQVSLDSVFAYLDGVPQGAR